MYDYIVSEKLEQNEKYQSLKKALESRPIRLWKDGNIEVGRLEITQSVVNQICLANGMKKLVLGFDSFEQIIKNNKSKGIILVANDASERFYRNLEKRLYQNPGRFFPIYLERDSVSLGEKVLKKTTSLKFLFIEGENMYQRILPGFFA